MFKNHKTFTIDVYRQSKGTYKQSGYSKVATYEGFFKPESENNQNIQTEIYGKNFSITVFDSEADIRLNDRLTINGTNYNVSQIAPYEFSNLSYLRIIANAES